MKRFLLCSIHSCIQKLILFMFVFLAFNVVLSKSNETGIFSSPVFAQSCSPALLGSNDGPQFEQGIYVSGNTAYVATRTNGLGNLNIINITNPAGPVLLGSYDLSQRNGCHDVHTVLLL